MTVKLGPSERFADRHIGPDAREEAEMLQALGAPTLDALIAETVPEDIRFAGTLDLPPPAGEAEVLAELRGTRREEPGLEIVPRDGLRGLLHAAGHSAQHPGEPGLVHAVHAVPGGDLAGPPRSAAELPDDGGRSDRAADRQRVAAGRGHRRRRGDAHASRAVAHHGRAGPRRRVPGRSAAVTRRRIEVVRTRAKPLGIEVRVGDPETLRLRARAGVRRAAAVPGHRRRAARPGARLPPRARRRQRWLRWRRTFWR